MSTLHLPNHSPLPMSATNPPTPLSLCRQTPSPDTFRTLVLQHSPAVYAHCLRQLRDPAAAEDAVQATFLILAQKLDSLPDSTLLAGYLHNTARYVCLTAKRTHSRRSKHERIAANLRPEAHMPPHASQTLSDTPTYEDLEPHLDDALADLRPADRDVIVHRFLEHRSTSELASLLQISEDAAKQRVSRALTKLRTALAARGLSTSSASLPVVLGFIPNPATIPLPPSLVSATTLAITNQSPVHITLLAKGATHAMQLAKLTTLSILTAAGLGVIVALSATALAFFPPTIPPSAAVQLPFLAVAQSAGQVTGAPVGGMEEPVPAPDELQGVWNFAFQDKPGTLIIRGSLAVWITDHEYSPADIVLVDTTSKVHGFEVILRPEGMIQGTPSTDPHPEAGTRKAFSYALNKDGTLTFALSRPGTPRPTTLTPTPDSRILTLYPAKPGKK